LAVAAQQESRCDEAAKLALARLAETKSTASPKQGLTLRSQRKDEEMLVADAAAEATRCSQAARVGAAPWRQRVTFVPLEDPGARAAAAPSSCATMKAGASEGRMPANVSLAARARVTAGLANDVEAVNQ